MKLEIKRPFFTGAINKNGKIEIRLHTHRKPKGEIISMEKFEKYPKKWVQTTIGIYACFPTKS
jgi:hypothetical protein